MLIHVEKVCSILIVLVSITSLTVMAETVSPLNTNGVRLQQKEGQKILVTTKAFRKGDPLLIVPCESCLLAHRSGYIGGLQGQTDQLWDEVILSLNRLMDDSKVRFRNLAFLIH
jgi:hypothetical protein